MEQALESVEVLAELMPNNPLALDRPALLHYRLDERDQYPVPFFHAGRRSIRKIRYR